MITYSKSFWGMPTLLGRFHGSAVPRCFVPALLSVGVSAALRAVDLDGVLAGDWRHPYPYQVFAFVVGFAVAYRCNYSYVRYMDARANVQQMSDKLAEAAITFFEFDNTPETADIGAIEAHRTFQAQLLHLFSLMHALCLQHLRRDWNLDNLLPHQPQSRTPPVDARAAFQKDNISAVAHMRGFAIPRPQLVNFARKMSRRLFKSMFVLGTDSKERELYYWLCPLGVLGGVLPEERDLLEGQVPPLPGPRISTHWDAPVGPCPIPVQYKSGPPELPANLHSTLTLPQTHASNFRNIDAVAPPSGFACGYAPPVNGRVYTVVGWIHTMLKKRINNGGLNMPPPVVARPYALLSDALHGFSQARKMAETPFPFPFAQVILVLLIGLLLTAPIMIAAFVSALWLQMLVNFLVVSTYWVLNEVARDLEDPFLYDPNDFPMAYMQHNFNENTQAATYGRMPNLNGLVVAAHDVAFPHFHDPSIPSFGTLGPRGSQHGHVITPRSSIGAHFQHHLDNLNAPLLEPVLEGPEDV